CVCLVEAWHASHVEVAGVQLRLMGDDVVDGGDHVADAAVPGIVEYPQHGEVRVRRDPRPAAGRVEPVARNDAGDVRAVAVWIGWHGRAGDEVDEPIDALRRGQHRVGQIVVPGCDAGVDHRDPDAGPVEAEFLPDGR